MYEEYLASYSNFLLAKQDLNFIVLLGLGLIGGLVSSLSPCVLSLLPINLAYIGTLNINSRAEAAAKAGAFVLGVSVVLTLLGVFSGLAFAVFSEYSGIIFTCVGIFVLIMALALIEIIKLPLPQFITKMPETNPFVIGLLFALVSSPCSSPVLAGILSIAGSTGSIIKSVLIMFLYSIGYTAIIFLASLSAGLMKQLNWFKEHSSLITKISAALLFIVGGVYLFLGLQTLLN